jgi:hypothetical protein
MTYGATFSVAMLVVVEFGSVTGARTLTQDEIDGSKYIGITVGQLCTDYLRHIQDPANPRRPSDQANPPQRLRAIEEMFGGRSALSVMPYEVEDWLKGLKKKPGTLNRYRSTFSSVYRYAKERAKISIHPVRDTMQSKVHLPNPHWLQPDEEKALRTVLNDWIAACPPHHRIKRLFLRCHPIELTIKLSLVVKDGISMALSAVPVYKARTNFSTNFVRAFECNSPGFKCSDNAVKSRKTIENKEASLRDLSAA